MRDTKFEKYEDLVGYVLSNVELSKTISIVAYAEDIAEVMRYLLAFGSDIKIGFMNGFDCTEYAEYKGEYYLTIDETGVLGIERAMSDNRVMMNCADIGLYFSDVHNKIASVCDDGIQYEIEVLDKIPFTVRLEQYDEEYDEFDDENYITEYDDEDDSEYYNLDEYCSDCDDDFNTAKALLQVAETACKMTNFLIDTFTTEDKKILDEE